MAFTAKIDSITPNDDGTGAAGINFIVGVTFADSVSGFTSTKTYSFPSTTTQAAAVAQITADGNSYKSKLATLSNLQGKVGSVITI